MLKRLGNVLPVDDKMKGREGDAFRNCKADDYHQNLPHVECAPFAPVQFRALTITCGVLLVLSVVAIVYEKCYKRPKHPIFGHNKVVIARPRRAINRVGLNNAPFGRVATGIEVFGQERHHTLNVQSRDVVAHSMNLFNKRSNSQQQRRVELPLSTVAGSSANFYRLDQLAETRWKNATWKQKEVDEIEFFDQRKQSIMNMQSGVRPPSMKFSRTRSGQKVTCQVELARRTSADRREMLGRRGRPLRQSRKAVLFRPSNEMNEIEYLEQSSQGISNWQSQFKVPSLNFSNRTKRSNSAAKMRSRNRSRSQRFKLKITPL